MVEPAGTCCGFAEGEMLKPVPLCAPLTGKPISPALPWPAIAYEYAESVYAKRRILVTVAEVVARAKVNLPMPTLPAEFAVSLKRSKFPSATPEDPRLPSELTIG